MPPPTPITSCGQPGNDDWAYQSQAIEKVIHTHAAAHRGWRWNTRTTDPKPDCFATQLGAQQAACYHSIYITKGLTACFIASSRWDGVRVCTGTDADIWLQRSHRQRLARLPCLLVIAQLVQIPCTASTRCCD